MNIANPDLRQTLSTLEDQIINYRIGKITFTIADVSGFNDFPVVDVEVLDPKGKDLFSDLSFETLEEAMQAIANYFDKDTL